ncbi:MAG: hypothetical protein JNL38_34245 [Myxococcales bacterium]|nr:hypothetical protein [Myxococcales bacterium]
MHRRTHHRFLALVSVLAAACGGDLTPSPPPGGGALPPGGERPSTLPPDTVDPGGTGPSYDGKGFVVHEWGTNTVVVGSDGAIQRGLHHEEEDLPAFVYDRRKKEVAQRSVDVKMETPVLYFYSPKPLTARVVVDFPSGVLSQWYPAVSSFWPPVLVDTGDPALDRGFPFTSTTCRDDFSRVHEGRLDWMNVQILPRGEAIRPPEAPLDRFTWSHARAVASNPLRVGNVSEAGVGKPDQAEQFLFYRGLGNFPLDVTIAARPGAAGRDGGVVLANRGAAKVGAVFVLRVEADKAAFVVRPEGIAPGKSMDVDAPPATRPLDAYADDLAKVMVAELDRGGLYHDESIGMVKTWARQWFRTPGVRVLYLSPQSATEAQIPLTVDPKPDAVVRQMVIRAEVITPLQEEVDVARARDFEAASEAARVAAHAHFDGLGRFAEPRLRRALALAPEAPKSAYVYLDRVARANVSIRVGE